ncbi:hypothetical protein V6Z12_D04G072200 [Gossypium hirsutum]
MNIVRTNTMSNIQYWFFFIALCPELLITGRGRYTCIAWMFL